jgi:hypothetical protein
VGTRLSGSPPVEPAPGRIKGGRILEPLGEVGPVEGSVVGVGPTIGSTIGSTMGSTMGSRMGSRRPPVWVGLRTGSRILPPVGPRGLDSSGVAIGMGGGLT